MKKKNRNKKFYFSYIEMMVVVLIVGILAGFAIYNMNEGVNKARDAQKKSDEKSVIVAVSYAMQQPGFQAPRADANNNWWVQPVIDARLMNQREATDLQQRLERCRKKVVFNDGNPELQDIV